MPYWFSALTTPPQSSAHTERNTYTYPIDIMHCAKPKVYDWGGGSKLGEDCHLVTMRLAVVVLVQPHLLVQNDAQQWAVGGVLCINHVICM